MRHKNIYALAVVAALAITACGSDDDSSAAPPEASDAASETTPDTAAEETPTESSPSSAAGPATGDPIRFGFINLEGGSLISIPQFRIGAEAAVAYVNENMGGIGGRPIELVRCNTNATPESSAACANQLVDADVPLVAMGVDANPGPIVETLAGAGITYVTNTGNTTAELTTPGSFAFTAGVPSTLAAYASYAQTRGFDKLALMVVDNPASTQAAEQLGGQLFGNAGVELEIVKVPAGAPDMSAQVAAAESSGADIIATLADPAFCLSFFSAYEAVGAALPVLLHSSCIRADVLAEAPQSLLGNSYAAEKLQLDDSGEEGELYRSIIEKEGQGEDPQNPHLAGGYAVIMVVARLLQDYDGPATSEALADALAAASAPYPMAPGVEIACDGTAIPNLPNACSATEFIYQVTGDRQLELIDSLNVAPLFE